MEDVDCLEPIDVLGVAPIGDIVAHPLDEILEFSVSDLDIKVHPMRHVSKLEPVANNSYSGQIVPLPQSVEMDGEEE